MTTTPAFPLTRPQLLHALAEHWWLWLLRGVAAVAFGVLAFLWPGLTLLTLILLWGAYAIADGILALLAALGRGASVAPRWWLAVVGLAGILAGMAAFGWPGITAFLLVLLIASWAILTGVLQILGAIQLRKEIAGEFWLILSGALSVAFGVILFMRPAAGALALAWLIAWYAIIYGAASIGLAFRLRSHRKQL